MALFAHVSFEDLPIDEVAVRAVTRPEVLFDGDQRPRGHGFTVSRNKSRVRGFIRRTSADKASTTSVLEDWQEETASEYHKYASDAFQTKFDAVIQRRVDSRHGLDACD